MDQSKVKRYKGKFMSEKKYNRLMKLKEGTIKRLEEKRKVKDADLNEKKCILEGRRIVDFEVIARYMHCSGCQEILSFRNIDKEVRHGLASILHIKCIKCLLINLVPTSKHDCKGPSDGRTFSVNTEAVQGCKNAGLNMKIIKKFLRIMDIPGDTSSIFQSKSTIIGPETKQAAEERQRLEAENQKKQVKSKAKDSKKKTISLDDTSPKSTNTTTPAETSMTSKQVDAHLDSTNLAYQYHSQYDKSYMGKCQEQNPNQHRQQNSNFYQQCVQYQGTNSNNLIPYKNAILQQYSREQDQHYQYH